MTPSRRAKIIENLISKNGLFCHLCKEELLEAEITLDHIIPQSKGGSSTLNNFGLAHRHCNIQKADNTVIPQPFVYPHY